MREKHVSINLTLFAAPSPVQRYIFHGQKKKKKNKTPARVKSALLSPTGVRDVHKVYQLAIGPPLAYICKSRVT